jgi:hypothetical protein
MPTNYMDTDDSAPLLGHFIGQTNLSFWSTPDEESKGKADYENSDQYKLYWNVNVLDILQDYSGEDVKSVNLSFGIGKDWMPLAADPNQIRHKDDPGDEAVEAGDAKPILFRTTSGLGTLLALISGKLKTWETDEPAVVMDEGGPLDVNMRQLGRHFNDNEIYDSRDCTIWEGLIFEYRGIGLKYGQRKPRMSPKPVRWLPEFSGATDLSKLSEARDTGAAPDTQTWVEAGADDATAATLEALAQRSKSHAAFAKNAALLPAVKDNETLMAAVMDETNGNWGA